MAGSQENNVGEQEGTFSFIQEEIVPRKKSRIKRVLIIFCKTVGVAIVFGVVSSLIFVFQDPILAKYLVKIKAEKK